MSSKTKKPLVESTNVPVDRTTNGKTIEQIYQKKTPIEHVLLRPDTYVGSIEMQPQQMWVFNSETKLMEFKTINYVPGLYKIFDEILVNAADNKQRDGSMDAIKITIDAEAGTVSVWNNGQGIPVEIHSEHNVYVPELIFGELLTSSNYDDTAKKVTGGRNGFGAKLTNIFSTEFIVETADSKRGRRFKQVYKNNMSEKSAPKIVPHEGKDFTCITFKPDLARFKMQRLDDDIVSLMTKRVYDMAGCTTHGVAVWLNGTKLPVKNFSQYVDLYLHEKLTLPRIYEKVGDRWEVCLSLSDGSFSQVSFVNSICTTKGGNHVNHVTDQMIEILQKEIKKKNKGGIDVKPHNIKSHMWIFVNSLIENPAFDSQTKETLTTRASAFGSKCELSEKFLKAVSKCGIVESIVDWAKSKQSSDLKRNLKGTKTARVTGIQKLEDANEAGTKNASKCTLILTEGDSAKALVMAGFRVVGREYYGVYPLRGKVLNVREATHSSIVNNEEIQNIVKIMGLKFGESYSDTKSLRYGSIMIMTDQDHDGSHIKGLLINFFHVFWPSLLRLPGFLKEFITPIVKCTKGNKLVQHYTIPEYEQWREDNDNGKGWEIKYYKGLGTSDAEEARAYFSNLNKHQINFKWTNDTADGDAIKLAFSKDLADARKEWLNDYEPGTFVDHRQKTLSYHDFVHKELILFSRSDNLRSIPALMDGLKPSQRKALFTCFTRTNKEIKVMQLASEAARRTSYHHGEVSMAGTIVGLAQNFVGSNNVNLLVPKGQFGTRLEGGADAASARYIHTKLGDIARYLFSKSDDPILNYLDDDGQSIEPEWYAPVIPLVLVNGSSGIGTGWRSDVPCYNPRDIITNLRRLLNGEQMSEMLPWVRGFQGTIEPGAKNNFVSYGIIQKTSGTQLTITELPLYTWTTKYKSFLETLMMPSDVKGEHKEALITNYRDNSDDVTVQFSVTLTPEKMIEVEQKGLEKVFKLSSSLPTATMCLFDEGGHIRRYDSAQDILQAFYHVRLQCYSERKSFMVQKLQSECAVLENKLRFILAVIKGELIVNNKKKRDILSELVAKKYASFSSLKSKYKSRFSTSEHEILEEEKDENEEENNSDDGPIKATEYNYLLSMPLWSLTMEKVAELRQQLAEKSSECAVMRGTSEQQMWLSDLEGLTSALTQHDEVNTPVALNSTLNRKLQANAAPRPVLAIKATKTRQPKAAKATDSMKIEGEVVEPTAKKTVKRVAKKKVVDSDESSAFSDESDVSVEEVVPVKKTAVRAAKAQVPQKKKKIIDSDEEEEEEEDEEDIESDEDWGDSNSDDMVDVKPVKKAAAASKAKAVAPKAKPAKTTTAAATTKKQTKAKAPVKGAADSDDDDFDMDMDAEPAVPVKKPAARAAKAKSKKVVLDSDDSEAELDLTVESPARPMKTAAPRYVPPPAPVAVDDDDESKTTNDVEVESLSQRLAKKFLIGKPTSTVTAAKPATIGLGLLARPTAVKVEKENLAPSAMSMGFTAAVPAAPVAVKEVKKRKQSKQHDEDFAMSASPDAKPARAKKLAKNETSTSTATAKKGKASKAAVAAMKLDNDDDIDSFGADLDKALAGLAPTSKTAAAAAKKAKPVTTQEEIDALLDSDDDIIKTTKPKAKRAPAKPKAAPKPKAEKKAPVAKKAVTKKSKKVVSDDEEDDEEVVEMDTTSSRPASAPAAAPARAKRAAAAKAKYVLSEEESEVSEFEEDDEEFDSDE